MAHLAHLISSPFLLRRHVRALESIAESLRDLRDHTVSGGVRRSIESDPEGVDVSYTRDIDSYRHEQDDRRRAQGPRAGAEGDD